ncbi:MAG: type II toxin-antitoxin system HicB family antitoxin [Calditrichia bacterium]
MVNYKLTINIEKDQYGYFAICPGLKNCHAQAETFDHVMTNIKEAIELCLESMTDEEKKECCGKEIPSTHVEISE